MANTGNVVDAVSGAAQQQFSSRNHFSGVSNNKINFVSLRINLFPDIRTGNRHLEFISTGVRT